MSNVLNKLTEGIVSRNVSKEGEALLDKWSKTGLLEGIGSDHSRQSMACLLENQAKELLREANTMAGPSGGAIEGFASVAFPIVRRVFGGLLANDLVSVQPMSLPSGLIFFLDFQHGGTLSNANVGPYTDGTSVYGGGVVGKGIADGVTDIEETGFYSLSQGYSAARGESQIAIGKMKTVIDTFALDGTQGAANAAGDAQRTHLENDADLLAENGSRKCAVVTIVDLDDSASTTTFTAASSSQPQNIAQFNKNALTAADVAFADGTVVRRLTKATYNADGSVETLTFVVVGALTDAWDSGGTLAAEVANKTNDAALTMTYQIDDNFTASGHALGALGGIDVWDLEGTGEIPEIDIKVDSVAITASTRKLKAKWTPELGQDLNAYHNLDAEVELTSILSEQIALEIDQEILKDLLAGATAGKRFWSKLPGTNLNADGSVGTAMDFTGNVSEWYETLVETINDVSADIHRKTLRGGANFIVCGPETANVLEFTSGFRASVTHDADRGTVGGYKDGSINKKWDLYVDPYFPRNVVLVGRKGSSFLESGYVYAPYVPLQTTPTIFGPEDFVPRKGVMTRYGKKMVRPDMYGVVVIRDM